MRTWKSVIAAAAVSLAWAGPALALQGTIIVKGPKAACGGTNPYNVAANGGWALVDGAPGATYDLVIPPLAPPAGAGALVETVGAGGSGVGQVVQAVNINPNFAGQPLGALALVITDLTYDNLDATPGVDDLPTFMIFVDLDMNGSIDDQMIFFPAANGCGGFGLWTECTPLPSGAFFNVNPAADPDGNPATPFTFLQYITLNGGAQLPAVPNPSIGILMGVGPPAFSANSAFADDLVLDGAAPLSGPFDDIQCDFEADCAFYGADADADCYCETLNPLVLIQDQCLGLDDRTDAAPADGSNDTDGDNVYECRDNCPFVADPTNADTDTDTVGDACDNCPADPNPAQTDTDFDGVGDDCELCDTDPLKVAPGQCGCGTADTDTDSDTIADCNDNCDTVANLGQEDLDGDTIGDACDDDDAGGLSARRVIIVNSNIANKDKWTGQAEIDTTSNPNFLDDAVSEGITVSLRDDNAVLVDSETFAAGECVRTGPNGNALRCKNAAKSVARFAKRPSVGFFRLTLTIVNQSLTSPAVADTPLHLRVTSPGSIDQNDEVDTCAQKGARLVCNEAP